MTEPELIEGILRRDRNAFQHLVNRYQRQVIKTACYFVGNMQDAEDLSQEVFIDILHSIGSFKGTSSLTTWIYRLTVNKSLNHVKKQKRREIIIRLESMFWPSHDSQTHKEMEPSASQDMIDRRENRELLQAALNRLPENQRIAFVLHKYEEQTYRQITEIMKIGLPAVESLIHRAKLNLQKHLIHQFSEYKKT
jgi:RNA polymerase sigma-70 factor (ECF subfamily)